jgi:signal transduction histidine kinase
MQERVEMAGGSFQVDTSPGAGVRLRAMFRVPAAS